LFEASTESAHAVVGRSPTLRDAAEVWSQQELCDDTLEMIERQHVLTVLRQSDWVIEGPNGTAKRLDLTEAGLIFTRRTSAASELKCPGSCHHRMLLRRTIEKVPSGGHCKYCPADVSARKRALALVLPDQLLLKTTIRSPDK
jgi:hypothetical protein